MASIALMAQLPAYVREHILGGADGKIRCPKCDGGRTGEISLSVYAVDESLGAVRLHCWRASCGWTALTLASSSTSLQIQRGNIKLPKVYRAPLRRLLETMNKFLESTYGVRWATHCEHGWREGEHGELVMPIRCPLGSVRGHVTRTFNKPKCCYTYKATVQPWLDWWPGDVAGPLVIVEDCLSAARLSGINIRAVALLGTGLTVEQAEEIAKYSQDSSCVYLALDRDAFSKAIKLRRRHKHIVDLHPVCLSQDIKNTKENLCIRKLFGVNKDD